MANVARAIGGPIPGQSLTREQGASPWEKPPQYVDPDDAMDFLLKQVTEPKHAHSLLALIESGVTLSTIVGTLLQGGFMEGKWTPDVAILLIKPLTALLIKLCNMYEIEYEAGQKAEEIDDAFIQLANANFKRGEMAEAENAVGEAKTALGGLMGPRGAK